MIALHHPLEQLSREQFVRAWSAVAYLFPGLHPDSHEDADSGCPQHATKPKYNRAFWQKKLAGNKERDRRVTRTLRRAGWRVLRVWEHELALRNQTRLRRRIQRALVDLR